MCELFVSDIIKETANKEQEKIKLGTRIGNSCTHLVPIREPIGSFLEGTICSAARRSPAGRWSCFLLDCCRISVDGTRWSGTYFCINKFGTDVRAFR